MSQRIDFIEFRRTCGFKKGNMEALVRCYEVELSSKQLVGQLKSIKKLN